jgi:hypothetical protein
MSLNPSADLTPTFTVLFVPYVPQSENVIRTQHWTRNHKESKRAKEAWLYALRSSDAAIAFWTATTSKQAASLSEMPSPELSDSTTPTIASDGNTDKSEQTESKE